MNAAELRSRHRHALALEIGDLAGNQLRVTGRLGQFAHKTVLFVALGGLGLVGQLEGQGKQRVPGEHRDAFTVNDVIRRHAPTQIVVVHPRQIVVDQRVGVDALDGGAEDQRVAGPAAARLCCGHAKDRPKSFTTRKHRVAHRLMQRLRLCRRLG